MSQPGIDPWGVAAAPAAPADPWGTAGDEPFGEDEAKGALNLAITGAQVTSQKRSRADNARVGGVPNSMHLSGQAMDFVLPHGTDPAAVRAEFERQGYPITEWLIEKKGDPHSTGDHIHWGWAAKGAAPAAASNANVDPWGVAPTAATPPPALRGDVSEGAPQTGGQKVTPPPESSWAQILHPDIASMWDRWKSMGVGVAQYLANQDPTAPTILGVPVPFAQGALQNAPKAVQDRVAAARKPMNDWLDGVQADIQADIKTNAPNVNQGSAKSVIYQTLSGVSDMVPALATMYATKSPAVAALVMGETAAGQKYADALDHGRTRDEAGMDATFSGMVNGAMGLVPLNALMKPGGTFLGQTLRNAGAFGVQNVATEALQIGYDKGLVTPNMTLKEAWGRIEQAGIVGTLTGAFFGAGHAGFERAVNRFRAQPTPQQPRAEPTFGTEPPDAGPNGPAASAQADIGLTTPGRAPEPDPWEPAADQSKPFRTTPANIADEHALEVARLEREAAETAARSTAPARPPTDEFTDFLNRQGVIPGEGSEAPVPPSKTYPRDETELAKDEFWGASKPPPPIEINGKPLTFPQKPEPRAALPEGEGIPRRALEADTAITASGREVPVRYAVIEASHLVPSQTQEGSPNPNYPQELQPRDRTRAVSQAQIASIAQNINPRLLGPSVSAADGAPIISASGIVESGNGRTLAIQRAYGGDMASAQAYRDHLASEGYPVEGMTAPVLVRIREGEMTPEDRQAFVREANQSAQLGHSATERAMTDAAAMPEHVLDLYRGGDVDSVANRDFVRTFMRTAIPTNEHAGMIDQHGGMSAQATQRVRAALLAKAYGDPDMVARIIESPDDSIKAIGGALGDVAADWARMRARANDGSIPDSLDQTPKLLEAVNLVRRARDEGHKLFDLLAQRDIFSGDPVDPDVEAWLRLMFRNTKDWTKPVGREKLADALRFYATEAQKAQVGPDLLGNKPVEAGDVLATARAKQEAAYAPAAETRPSLLAREDVRARGGYGEGPGYEGAEALGSPGLAEDRAQGPLRNGYGPVVHGFRFEAPAGQMDRNQPLIHDLDEFFQKSAASPKDVHSAVGALANYILGRGRQYGVESIGAWSPDGGGKIYASTTNEKTFVSFGGLDEFLRQPQSRLVTLHNHPSGTAPSFIDFGSLGLPGHAVMAVVPHTGGWHAHRLAARFDPSADADARMTRITAIAKAADDAILPILQDAVNRRVLAPDTAWRLHRRIANEAMDRAGVTEYLSSDHLEDESNQPLIRQALKASIAAAKGMADANGLRIELAPRTDGVYRPAESLRFTDGVAKLLGQPAENAGQPAGIAGAGTGAGLPRAPYRKPEQLRLLEDENRYERERPVFYSALTRAIDESKMSRAPAKDWLGFIDNLKNKGVKDEEVDYSGLREWLRERAPNTKGIPDSVFGHANRLRNFIETKAFRAHGFGGLDIPSKAAVLKEVVGAAQDRKVLNAIIGSLPVDVMDVLRARQFSPERLFHDQAMLKNLTASAPNSDVAIPVDVATAAVNSAARKITEIGLANTNVERSLIDRSSAGSADRHGHGPRIERPSPLTKADILQFLRENEVRVQEVMKGGTEVADLDRQWNDAADAVNKALHDRVPEAEERRLRAVRDGIREQLDAAREKPNETKFSDYALPGGDNYRELLLTLPHQPIPQDRIVARARQIAQDEGDSYDSAGKPRKELYEAHARSDLERNRGTYRSGHWKEPNVLAHIRFDTREGPDGEKILHISEIQSDWGQRLRRSVALRQVAKPQSIGELADDVLGREMAASVPLEHMDGGVLSALKNDKVRGVIAAGLPIDVVNNLRAVKATPEELLRNPDVIIARLPEDHRGGVARAILSGARRTTAILRAKLADAYERGVDEEVLPAVRASDMSAREIVGTLAPEAIYHDRNSERRGGDRAAPSGAIKPPTARTVTGVGPERLPANETDFLSAPLSAFGRTESGATPRRLNGKFGAARIADLLNWHNRIVSTPAHYEATDLPRMPLEKTWHEAAIKRVLRYGAEHGYDKVSWDTGETQADRYDLSKQVSKINAEKMPTGNYSIEIFDPDGGGMFAPKSYTQGELAEHVGKELAEKIVGDLKNSGDAKSYNGLDLKVGGAGMKGFYDRILPQFLSKYVKKWGAKVGKSELATGPMTEERAPVHEVSITPAMRESVMGGQALFEDENRYKEEPGATDAAGNALPQIVIPGAEKSATQLAKAREAAGHGLKTTKATQKEAGPLFGPGEGAGGGGQGSLFETPSPFGSARPLANLGRTLREGAANAMDLVHDAQMLLAPMAEGSSVARATAKTFANMIRLGRWHGQRMDELLKKGFTPAQRRKMWEAADQESVARQQGQPTAGIGLSTLTPEERRAVLEQQQDAQNVWKAAQDLGMVSSEGLPSYVPRMMVEVADTGVRQLGSGPDSLRSIPGIGHNLRTKTSQMLRRRHLTSEETEAAGSTKFDTAANIVKDIRTLPLATARLREAVAGRALINKIKDVGRAIGDDTVVEGNDPSRGNDRWFHLNHPSFFTWRPKFIRDPETGEYVVQKDQNGDAVLEKTPLWVRGDFEGPLKAVLTQDQGRIYNALMNLKGKAMTTIMYSPLIHNAVEWGRALPAMPGKVLTMRVYFEGNAAKRNPETMTEAITHGLVPIGHQGGYQDITSIATTDNIKAGRSWTAKALGAIPGLFDPRAKEAVYRAIDRMGDIWHNTLLWDRVGDLQMGLYTNLRDQMIGKGYAPDTAQYVAAHFANRYAGALPQEAMSTMSRKIANLLLFSRTYTLGNLGAMKDVFTGLPRDVQAQIEQSGGDLNKVKSLARRKALGILITDIALFYAANSLLQSGIAYISKQKDLSEIEKGYVDRLIAEGHRIGDNPLELLNPFGALQNLSATSENEAGREDRVFVGTDHNGTAIYARNPVGKIGEEFKNWLTQPLDTFKKKLGTLARPTYEVLTNDAGFGRHVYDPNAKGTAGLAQNAGRIVSTYLGAQIPLDSLKSAYAMATGKGGEIDTYKTLGPLAGVTFSKGAPGGPAVGYAYQLEREHQAKVQAGMPDVIEKIKNGDVQGARIDMKALGVSPGLANWYVRTTLNPKLKMNTRKMREMLRSATPQERARLQELRGATP